MEKGFWLVSLDSLSVSVSLVTQSDGKYFVRQLGPIIDYDINDPNSLLLAVDQSLSSASESANLNPADEPDSAAFILPPSWISSDGKISPQFLKLIEVVCKNLKLKPLGFVAHDEAIVEATSSLDGFPVSFILVYIDRQLLSLTLVYLGKIKERIEKVLTTEFTPEIIENILVEIGSESALPPQIILFGQITDNITNAVKNYSWIGKKNIETFLHFPDVSVYSPIDLANIYSRVIGAQFSDNAPLSPTEINNQESIETTDTVEVISEDSADLVEVSAEELGFSSISNPEPEIKSEPELIPQSELIPVSESISQPIPTVSVHHRLHFFSLPKIKFIPWRYFIFIPLLLIMVVSGLIFFSSSQVIVYLTPYSFSKSINITLDPSNSDYPVSQKTFEVNSDSLVKTTGQKTVGSNAKGEVTIFNKSDKIQNLPSGTILTSSNGLKFTTVSSVQIPASSSNLDTGIITMGQTRVMVAAVDIGPESNLTKDAQLSTKDSTSIIIKVNNNFTGGSKQQIAAVSADDKKQLEQKIKNDIESSIQEKLNKELSEISGIIPNTTTIKRNRIEYSREVGEEAEELSATSNNTVSVLYLVDEQKIALINKVFADTPDFNKITVKSSDFNFDYIKGKLTITGKSSPQLDTNSLRQKLTGKLVSQAPKIIRQFAPRTYNYQIISPLPFLIRNITIELK